VSIFLKLLVGVIAVVLWRSSRRRCTHRPAEILERQSSPAPADGDGEQLSMTETAPADSVAKHLPIHVDDAAALAPAVATEHTDHVAPKVDGRVEGDQFAIGETAATDLPASDVSGQVDAIVPELGEAVAAFGQHDSVKTSATADEPDVPAASVPAEARQEEPTTTAPGSDEAPNSPIAAAPLPVREAALPDAHDADAHTAAAGNVTPDSVDVAILATPEEHLPSPPVERTSIATGAAALSTETVTEAREIPANVGEPAVAALTREPPRAASPPEEFGDFSERPVRGAGNSPLLNGIVSTTTPPTRPSTGRDTAEEKASTQRSPRTPVPAIDASEYVGRGSESLLPARYTRWNTLISGRFVRNASQAQIHLAISPRALASISSEATGARVLPVDAEADFLAAVSEVYTGRVIGTSARLKMFRRYGEDGTPLCIAFLALSVLAAHKMHSDDTSSGAAYYIRLAELLKVARDPAGYPQDFRTLEFESLWRFFADWVSTSTSSSLVLSNADDQRRFIAYPLAHVPLRQLDLEKLPEFFDWAGYSPEKRVSPARLAEDLRRWEQSYGRLSHAGRTALADERSGAVLSQVSSELRAWDGTVATTQGTRSVQAEVLLEAAMRRFKLSLLVPRREGFPPVFRTAQVELTASDAWYEPVELGAGEGTTLLNGFTWTHDQNASYVVRRLPSKAIVLAPNSEYSGLVSRHDLPKNTSCAVLCHDSLVETVAAYLRTISDTVATTIVPRNFPLEWQLFQNVRAVRHNEVVPEQCEGLAVAAYADIIPQGGLRLGALWSWILGSPPRILIEGRDGRQVYINDAAVSVDDEGYVTVAEMFELAGAYTIRVASVERTIRIAEPSLRPIGPALRPGFEESGLPRHPVVLSAGAWTLIGPHPNMVSSVRSEGIRDSLVLCDFEPSWAIKVGSGKGSKAIQISAMPVHIGGHQVAGLRQWASTIYEAGIRHPELLSEIGASREDLRRCWSDYVSTARQLKRHWRAR
jgi:hypothetical protein